MLKLFIAKQSVPFQFRFFLCVGPCLLLFALAAALAVFHSGFAAVAGLAFGGLGLSWKWHLKGCYLALAALLGLSLWQFAHPSSIPFFWHLGLDLSIGGALWITALAQEEVEEISQGHDQDNEQLHSELKQLRSELIRQKQQQESYHVALDHAEEKLISYKQLLETMQQENEQLRQKNTVDVKLLDQLNEARTDKFQLSLLTEVKEKERQTREAEVEALKQEATALREQLEKALLPTPGEKNYELLRAQFHEKSEVLNRTRRDLFQMESRLLFLQREQEEKTLAPTPEEEALTRDFREIAAESIELQEQVQVLQDLVSSFVTKKRKRKSSLS